MSRSDFDGDGPSDNEDGRRERATGEESCKGRVGRRIEEEGCVEERWEVGEKGGLRDGGMYRRGGAENERRRDGRREVKEE